MVGPIISTDADSTNQVAELTTLDRKILALYKSIAQFAQWGKSFKFDHVVYECVHRSTNETIALQCSL